MSEHIGYAIFRADGKMENIMRTTRKEIDAALAAMTTLYPHTMKGARIVEIHELGADDERQKKYRAHAYSDQMGNGYCFVCGLEEHHPEANHGDDLSQVEFERTIGEGPVRQ